MVSARLILVATAFAFQAAACGGTDAGSTSGPRPAPGGTGAAQPGTSQPGTSQPGAQADAGAPTSGGGSDAGVVAPDSSTTDTSACKPYIGKWIATLDPGAEVTGTDTQLAGGGPIPITGTIDFALVHDDRDYANVLDFTGNATIKGAGMTIQTVLSPATSPTGDPKDSTCDASGSLHFIGAANVNGIGNVVFTMVGTLDTTKTPTVGTGPFTMKTADDNGAALSGTGNVHFVRQ